MPQLLIELYSEEMPASLQEAGAQILKNSFINGLEEEGLTYGKSQIFWSPMRLSLIIENVASYTDDLVIEKRGPRKDSNNMAISGFAKSVGVKDTQLVLKDTAKGSFYFYSYAKKGEQSPIIIERVLKKIINNFSWSKSMRWGDGKLKWIRPLHSILCLFDKKPLKFSIEDIESNKFTYGHRFVSPEKIAINKVEEYFSKLKNNSVILDAKERIKIIKDQGLILAKNNKLIFKPSENLLKEVANLVECPYVFIASFDKEYLTLPQEILQLTMMKQQKYFPLFKKSKIISNEFLGVSNIPINSDDIAIGNAKVLKARLADAKFFYQNDIKKGLTNFNKGLKNVIFHRLLGSMEKKICRIKYFISDHYNIFGADKNISFTAANLCKADLCSEIVYEMPDLQGVIGSKYSELEGNDSRISDAIKEHYSPLGPNDICPSNPESVILSFADKIDTLVGFIASDLRPSGSKDPFGIRRSGIGLIRLILENNIRISLKNIISFSYGQYLKQNIKFVHTKNESIEIILEFLMERLKGFMRDRKLSQSCILAVCNITKTDDIFDIVQRINALDKFVRTQKGMLFIQGLKRVRRILSIEEKKYKVSYKGNINKTLLKAKEERELWGYFEKINVDTLVFLEQEKYEKAMESFLKIKNKLEKFFEKVQVNTEDDKLRINRLNILSSIRETFIDFADFSLIEIENDAK
ncbi:MAG: glycine--tRNA ligase subunit beta [Pelagibacterales bacterium]|nr:glycine--tRNA ligase subunit beta [Pelagibacterales bacterium]